MFLGQQSLGLSSKIRKGLISMVSMVGVFRIHILEVIKVNRISPREGKKET